MKSNSFKVAIIFIIVFGILIGISYIIFKKQQAGRDISSDIITFIVGLGVLIISETLIPLLLKPKTDVTNEIKNRLSSIWNINHKIAKIQSDQFEKLTGKLRDLEYIFLENMLVINLKYEEVIHNNKIILGKLDIIAKKPAL